MEPRHERIAKIALGALTQITDTAFAEYRTDPGMISDMRHRFAHWRNELLADDSASPRFPIAPRLG